MARICSISIFAYLRYIREELPITFDTASTESVLPQMMNKLERAGCEKTVVGRVLPAGYTFNPDGTAIYLTIGALFVAQATNIAELDPAARDPGRSHAGFEGVGRRGRRPVGCV